MLSPLQTAVSKAPTHKAHFRSAAIQDATAIQGCDSNKIRSILLTQRIPCGREVTTIRSYQ